MYHLASNQCWQFTKKRLAKQEQIDEVIFDKLKERQSSINQVYDDLHKNITQVERRLLLEIKTLKHDMNSRESGWYVREVEMVDNWWFNSN